MIKKLTPKIDFTKPLRAEHVNDIWCQRCCLILPTHIFLSLQVDTIEFTPRIPSAPKVCVRKLHEMLVKFTPGMTLQNSLCSKLKTVMPLLAMQ